MLSVFQIDFASQGFAWAIAIAFVIAMAMRLVRYPVTRAWNRFGKYPGWQMLAVGSLMFAVQAAIAARYGWPIPAVHDEFSYLLAADTFASGRITNPTHPAWEFLETYHVLWQPTYQSKYPPGNGLALAAGQVLTGAPIVGTWMCLALAAAGLYWMLRGWYPTRWAGIGTVVLLCNWPLTKLWGQSYFGGATALLGGVLVYGALGRLMRQPSPLMSIGLGLGLIIWSITRPYEGLIASLSVFTLLYWCYRRSSREDRWKWLTRGLIPLGLVLLAGLIGLEFYHQQVTGSPWKWPYRVYEETYTKRVSSWNTLFSWTELGTRTRTIPSLEYESSASTTRIAETKPVLYALWKTVRHWWFHVGLIWTIPFSIGCSSIARSWLRTPSRTRSIATVAAVSIGLVGSAILLQRSSGPPHYAAPVLPLAILLIVEGLRRLNTYRIGDQRVGQLLISWMVWTAILYFILPTFTGESHPTFRGWSFERERLLLELEQQSRPSLVIVRYGPKHSMHDEWVYNRADIDRTHVVWARELPSRMPELFRHFPNRDVWVVEPDTNPVVLKPYSEVSAAD